MQTVTITANGSYAVQVSNEFCADISSCVVVNLLSMEEITKDAIHVYPNPTGEGVTITMSIVSTKIEVIDSQGKLLETLTIGKGISTNSMSGASSTGSVSVVSLANYEPGVYFLRIITEDGIILRRVVKT